MSDYQGHVHFYIYIYIEIHFLCEDWQNKTKVYNKNCHWLPVFCTFLYGKSQPGLCHLPSQHWLIGGIPTPPKNMSSSDRIIIRLGKWKNPWFQTTNQLSDTYTHSIPQYTKIKWGPAVPESTDHHQIIPVIELLKKKCESHQGDHHPIYLIENNLTTTKSSLNYIPLYPIRILQKFTLW